MPATTSLGGMPIKSEEQVTPGVSQPVGDPALEQAPGPVLREMAPLTPGPQFPAPRFAPDRGPDARPPALSTFSHQEAGGRIKLAAHPYAGKIDPGAHGHADVLEFDETE